MKRAAARTLIRRHGASSSGGGPRGADAAAGDIATLVLGQRVHAGCEERYVQWHQQINEAAARQPGYLESIVRQPNAAEPQWITVLRFDSMTTMSNWLNSPARQALLDAGEELFDGPATQQVIAGRQHDDDALATVVANYHVAPDRSEAFLAWQQEIAEVQRHHRGFCGAEVFRPIEGVQDHWTVLYRFETAQDLDDWLVSEDRRELLHDNEFGDADMKRIDRTFGSWFSEDEDNAPSGPSRLKTAAAVWLGLYPTVLVLTLLISLTHLPLWLALLISNLASSFTMTYLTMPHYVHRLLGWWLSPAPNAPQPRTNVRGLVLIVAANSALALAAYLLSFKLSILQ